MQARQELCLWNGLLHLSTCSGIGHQCDYKLLDVKHKNQMIDHVRFWKKPSTLVD